MWKAFDELEQLGWITSNQRRPRLVSVQAAGCAPIVRAFESGKDRAATWTDPHTVADVLRVPAAIGDFLILQALRDSRGLAIAIEDDEMVMAMREFGQLEGISASPEGGATLCALRTLLSQGMISPTDVVVLFNTGGALKYLELIE